MKYYLVDSIYCMRVYDSTEQILKLNDDPSLDAGYHISTVEKAITFLKENY